MAPREKMLREILMGIDGLMLLGQWQTTLAKDLRCKVEALLDSKQEDKPSADNPPGRPA